MLGEELFLEARTRARLLGLVFAAALSGAACTSEEPASAQSACQPGQSGPCACGASSGTARCTPDGTWGVCQCATAVLADSGLPPASDAGKPPSPPMGTGMDAAVSAAPTGEDPLPCEITAIMSTHCAQCHGAQPQSGAPMPLVSWNDLQKPAPRTAGRSTLDLALDRMKSNASPMPPAPFARVGAAEIASYERWLGQGAPKGTGATCTSAPATPGDDGGVSESGNFPKPSDCEESFELKAHGAAGANDTSKFRVSSNPSLQGNQYHCFFFKPPYAAGSGMLWYDSVLDNKPHLHHWILYATDNATNAPGTSAPCNAAQPGAYFVAGWAPGANNHAVPPDATLTLPSGPNAGLILEVHYYNDSGKEQVDGSGIKFCTAKPSVRPHQAGVHSLGSEGICIPPGARGHEVVGECAPRTDRGDIHITGVWPHMHKQARRQKVVIRRANGATQVIHDEPFDFNAQIFYPKGDIVVKPGDTVATHCYYDNDTTQEVHFGERTQDEMCYSFVVAWPVGALTPVLGPSTQGVNRCADDLSIRNSCNGFLDAPVTVDHPD